MRYVSLITILLFTACSPTYTAQELVDKSIEYSGLNNIKQSKVTFDFRDKSYEAVRDHGKFILNRTFVKDSLNYKDVLSNEGFQRFINDSLVTLSDKDQNRFGSSVNSVHYFSVLPFGLNDKAVHKKVLSSVMIKGLHYYKIQVTFSEEGGGEDFDDVFIYWIRKDTFQLDYLAYKYQTNNGGIRFRELKEQCIKNGVRFVDYVNYKPENMNINFFAIDKLYEGGKLKKVSEIVLKNIEVQLNI